MSKPSDSARSLRLAADYDCFPLWLLVDGQYRNVDVSSVPLSDQLQNELERWSLDFDKTLNSEDPASSGFISNNAQIAFAERGEVLARRLKTELGDSWAVSYYDRRTMSDHDIVI
jgi:hypothetical protein